MTDILIGQTQLATFVLKDDTGVEVTGLDDTFTVEVSKAGGAFATGTGAKAEISDGWYSYAIPATETDTAGPLAIKITDASIEQTNLLYDVVGSSWTASPTYATLADTKAYLGIPTATTTDDNLITGFIQQARKAIEAYCGRAFEAASDTTHYFDVALCDGLDLYFDTDLCQFANTNAVANNADGTPQYLTRNTDYVTMPRNFTPWYGLHLLPNSSKYWTYASNSEMGIAVTGRWAYSVTPPDDIVHACIRLAAYYYRQKDTGAFDAIGMEGAGMIRITAGMPPDVRLILDGYKRL